ncbi:hypothetical protein ACVMAJ_007443 [Bradyrhizobium sp. USDA 4448]
MIGLSIQKFSTLRVAGSIPAGIARASILPNAPAFIMTLSSLTNAWVTLGAGFEADRFTLSSGGGRIAPMITDNRCREPS